MALSRIGCIGAGRSRGRHRALARRRNLYQSPVPPERPLRAFPRVAAHALLRRDAFLGQQLPQVGLGDRATEQVAGLLAAQSAQRHQLVPRARAFPQGRRAGAGEVTTASTAQPAQPDSPASNEGAIDLDLIDGQIAQRSGRIASPKSSMQMACRVLQGGNDFDAAFDALQVLSVISSSSASAENRSRRECRPRSGQKPSRMNWRAETFTARRGCRPSPSITPRISSQARCSTRRPRFSMTRSPQAGMKRVGGVRASWDGPSGPGASTPTMRRLARLTWG